MVPEKKNQPFSEFYTPFLIDPTTKQTFPSRQVLVRVTIL